MAISVRVFLVVLTVAATLLLTAASETAPAQSQPPEIRRPASPSSTSPAAAAVQEKQCRNMLDGSGANLRDFSTLVPSNFFVDANNSPGNFAVDDSRIIAFALYGVNKVLNYSVFGSGGGPLYPEIAAVLFRKNGTSEPPSPPASASLSPAIQGKFLDALIGSGDYYSNWANLRDLTIYTSLPTPKFIVVANNSPGNFGVDDSRIINAAFALLSSSLLKSPETAALKKRRHPTSATPAIQEKQLRNILDGSGDWANLFVSSNAAISAGALVDYHIVPCEIPATPSLYVTLANKLSGYEIGFLKKATVLDASVNRIQHSFGCLKSMQYLNISMNEVCKIGGLVKVTTLSWNYMTQVGPKCRKLIDLEIKLPNQKSMETCEDFFLNKIPCSSQEILRISGTSGSPRSCGAVSGVLSSLFFILAMATPAVNMPTVRRRHSVSCHAIDHEKGPVHARKPKIPWLTSSTDACWRSKNGGEQSYLAALIRAPALCEGLTGPGRFSRKNTPKVTETGELDAVVMGVTHIVQNLPHRTKIVIECDNQQVVDSLKAAFSSVFEATNGFEQSICDLKSLLRDKVVIVRQVGRARNMAAHELASYGARVKIFTMYDDKKLMQIKRVKDKLYDDQSAIDWGKPPTDGEMFLL